MKLLWWHWLTKLYRFWVYNSIIRHGYILLCVHHPSHVSFHHHLLPFTLFHLLQPPFPSGTHHPVVSMRFFLCLIPSPFSPSLQPPFPLTGISLFSLQILSCIINSSLGLLGGGQEYVIFKVWLRHESTNINFIQIVNGKLSLLIP